MHTVHGWKMSLSVAFFEKRRYNDNRRSFGNLFSTKVESTKGNDAG